MDETTQSNHLKGAKLQNGVDRQSHSMGKTILPAIDSANECRQTTTRKTSSILKNRQTTFIDKSNNDSKPTIDKQDSNTDKRRADKADDTRAKDEDTTSRSNMQDSGLCRDENIDKNVLNTDKNIDKGWKCWSSLYCKLPAIIQSIRPRSLMTSMIPVLLGAILALKVTGQFSPIILLLTILTAISVHAAGNLVNTYHDYVKGIDTNKAADDRTLVDHLLTLEEVSNLGVFFYIAGCFGYAATVACSHASMEILSLIYFGGISSSFLYTGGIGLKYIALGDFIIMLTFGPVTVLYSYVAQTGTIRLFTLLYSIPLALNAEAVLHSNNTRDIEDDRRAGCFTLAVLIGPTASHILFALLLFVPYILFLVGAVHWSAWLLLPMITLPKAFQLEKQFRVGDLRSIPRQMARLSLYFGVFYLAACYVSHPLKLPGLFH